MTGNIRDDILSAFYDGEASEEERAVCSKRLQESPQSQRELDEFKKLSQMLRSLPPNSLPKHFRAEVMQAAERRMLLPEAVPAADAKPTGRLHRRWWLSAAALVSSAAVLLLTVSLLDNPGSVEPAGTDARTAGGLADERLAESLVASAEPGEATEEHRGAAVTFFDDTDDTPAGRVSRGRQPDSQPADQPRAVLENGEMSLAERSGETRPEQPAESLARTGDDRETAAAGEPVAAPRPRHDAYDRGFPLTDSLADTPGLHFRKELQKADVGAVVEALDTSGEQVSVVKLTVVDRQVGLQNLQFALTRHRIPIDPSGASANEKETTDHEADAGPELIAVFVEATDSQLQAALLDLNVGKEFQDLSVEAPVRMAQLDDFSGNRLGRRDIRSRGVRVSPRTRLSTIDTTTREGVTDSTTESAESSSKPSPGQPSRRSIVLDLKDRDLGRLRNEPAALNADTEKPKSSPAAPGERDDAWYVQNSWQMQITVPRTLLDSNVSERSPSDAKAQWKRAGKGSENVFSPVKAPRVRRPDTPVPVLFVLDDRPAGGNSPNSGPAQPSPAATETPN